jgi:hypothetical protein
MKNVIPKCAKSFKSWRLASLDANKFYYNLGEPKPFDISMFRHHNKIDLHNFTPNKKKEIYDFILQKYNPENIEIDIGLKKNFYLDKTKKHYTKVTNLEELMTVINAGFTNFSFETSVSNKFQMTRTGATIKENYNNINNMLVFLDDSPLRNYNTRLYVNCITKCPIEGNIMINTVVDELVKLHQLRPDNICLVDDYGELKPVQLFNIYQGLMYNKIDLSKFSMQFHFKPEKEEDIEKLFHLSLDYGINDFNVSALNMYYYMPYHMYYKFLFNYINKKCD